MSFEGADERVWVDLELIVRAVIFEVLGIFVRDCHAYSGVAVMVHPAAKSVVDDVFDLVVGEWRGLVHVPETVSEIVGALAVAGSPSDMLPDHLEVIGQDRENGIASVVDHAGIPCRVDLSDEILGDIKLPASDSVAVDLDFVRVGRVRTEVTISVRLANHCGHSTPPDSPLCLSLMIRYRAMNGNPAGTD